MYLRVVIEEYGDEVEELIKVNDSLTEDEIVKFLHEKYGVNEWLGYNIEPE